jgi:hypothetical protein
VSVGTLDSLIVSGTVSFQADTAIGSDGSDTIIFNGKFIGNDPMIFEGNTQNSMHLLCALKQHLMEWIKMQM